MDEVAAHFPVSRRSFQAHIRQFPYYRSLGRRKLFTKTDIQKLYEALPCRSSSCRRDPGKTPYYSGRGTHLGFYVDRSTKARQRTLAIKIIRQWEREIEENKFVRPQDPTFASAALSYMQAGGERQYLVPLLKYFGERPLKLIDQAAIDSCASALVPTQSAATRNREIYTPISAVLKHVGYDFQIRRPRGWRGRVVRAWLWPEQAFRLLDAMQAIDAEGYALCVLLLYGGLRISEALKLRCIDVKPEERFAFVPDSKNGDPQPVHLSPFMLDALRSHPRGIGRGKDRLFRFHRGGGLNFKLVQARAVASGLPCPKRTGRGSRWPKLPPHELDFVTWHTFRRTYATWGRRYLCWDSKSLVDTGRWRSEESASRYAQTIASETLTDTDRLPVPARAVRKDP
jgi:integrase